MINIFVFNTIYIVRLGLLCNHYTRNKESSPKMILNDLWIQMEMDFWHKKVSTRGRGPPVTEVVWSLIPGATMKGICLKPQSHRPNVWNLVPVPGKCGVSERTCGAGRPMWDVGNLLIYHSNSNPVLENRNKCELHCDWGVKLISSKLQKQFEHF